MSEIVYYPNSQDVFDIDCQGGVCYYLICKNIVSSPKLELAGKLAKDSLISEKSYILYDRGCIYLQTNTIATIVKKVVQSSGFNQLDIHSVKAVNGGINIKFTNVFSDIKKMSKNPSYVLIAPYIDMSVNDINGHTSCIRVCKSTGEADSFISYLNTRFVRFLVFLNAFTVAAVNRETWRFVPAPDAFDHIFTDKELYDKYNLTPEEIAIIESVIKERK